jgi:hypothetical protein
MSCTKNQGVNLMARMATFNDCGVSVKGKSLKEKGCEVIAPGWGQWERTNIMVDVR